MAPELEFRHCALSGLWERADSWSDKEDEVSLPPLPSPTMVGRASSSVDCTLLAKKDLVSG